MNLKLVLFVLILTELIILGYSINQFKATGNAVYERVQVNLTRVIDGDTIDTELGKIRLLGINTPEKKQPFYQEAKDFLVQYTGKQIELENHGKDKYDRTLGYLYYSNTLMNSLILEKGLATLYVYEKDSNYNKLKQSEQTAKEKELGLWKKSNLSGCIELVKLDYVEKARCNNQEILTLNNKCPKIKTILKDDANHIENLEIPAGISSYNFSCVFNDAGDSLYIRDESGLLLFYRYP